MLSLCFLVVEDINKAVYNKKIKLAHIPFGIFLPGRKLRMIADAYQDIVVDRN